MFQLRSACADDFDFLWEMLFYASHADENPGMSPSAIRSDSFLRRYLDDWGRAGDLAVVAVDGTRRVGAAWLRLFTTDETDFPTFVDSETPELAIAVVPDRRGRGIGGQLLTELIANAEVSSVPSIVLAARAENRVIPFYQRHGFIEIDRVKNRVGTESIKMLRRCNGHSEIR